MKELAEGVGIVAGFIALIWVALYHPMALFWGAVSTGSLVVLVLAVYLAGGFSGWVWYKLAERFDWPVAGLDEGRKGEPSRTWVRAMAATRRMRPREWFRAPTEFDEEVSPSIQAVRDKELLDAARAGVLDEDGLSRDEELINEYWWKP